jgi:hypothetical protein
MSYADPNILTTTTMIDLKKEKVNLGEYGFDLMNVMIKFDKTFKAESVRVPKSIGSFKMVSYEHGKNNLPIFNSLPSANCKTNFASSIKEMKYLLSNDL